MRTKKITRSVDPVKEYQSEYALTLLLGAHRHSDDSHRALFFYLFGFNELYALKGNRLAN